MAASGTLAAGTSAPGAGSRKLVNLQALRGVAVLAVVCFHLLTIEARYGGSATILPGWFNAGKMSTLVRLRARMPPRTKETTPTITVYG